MPVCIQQDDAIAAFSSDFSPLGLNLSAPNAPVHTLMSSDGSRVWTGYPEGLPDLVDMPPLRRPC